MFNILHLASFQGNIGDNASHLGLTRILNRVIGTEYQLHPLEIRKFYNNYTLPDKLSFDEAFAHLVNKYDLLIIGGGNFLEYTIDNSVTGTTINITEKILKMIKVPVLMASIGCTPKQQISQKNVNKFQAFLDLLFESSNIAIAFRNDGSKNCIKEQIGLNYYVEVPQVLDSGFFYENDGMTYVPCESRYITLNTTIDQIAGRNRVLADVNTENYIAEMRKVMNFILDQTDINIVMTPHIYSDYIAINSLLEGINDFYIRSRIIIAPYTHGAYGTKQVFSAYKNSILSLGMRFHANVCSLAMSVPSIGIAALDRVVDVYDSIGLADNVIIPNGSFGTQFIDKIIDVVNGPASLTKNAIVKNRIRIEKEKTIAIYSNLLASIGAV